MRLRRVGLEADRLVEQLDRLFMKELAVAHEAKQDQHVGVVRFGAQNLPVEARGIIELPAQLMLVAVVE